MLYKQDFEQSKKRLEAWWQCEVIDRPVIQVIAKQKNVIPVSKWNVWSTAHFLDNPEYVIDEFEKYCTETYFGGEAIPNLWINIGPGIIGAYLGAEPKIAEDTVWFEPLKEWDKIEKRIEFDSENIWWKKTCKMTSVSTQRGIGKFFTALTDLGGSLDILASLRGTQELLFDLVDSPEQIKKISKKINELWFRYYLELYNIMKDVQEGTITWMGIWAPKRWYPLQCDFSAMLSPKMFEEFVLPGIEEQCKWLDYSVYHLDGPGQLPHLDMLLEIKDLNAIQWVPGAGSEPTISPRWFPYYKKILSKGKGLVLVEVKPEEVETLINELGPKGILIQTNCDTQEQAEQLLKQVSTF